MKNFFEEVYEIVAKIPAGRVATYGQIAMLLGNPRAARAVGFAMRALPEGLGLPWHRVVNKVGKLSGLEFQRELLESEGVTFLINGNIDMKKHIWKVE